MPETLTVDRNTGYHKSIILHAVTLVVTIINHAPHSSRTEDKIYLFMAIIGSLASIRSWDKGTTVKITVLHLKETLSFYLIT
ncbi:hypothetical protein [Methylovulum psychrotolerans]|uniref:Uncharacterized protein n=1 Tax=Methylovulum psychrotolerans TaxID=1704499 RepID=A0A2S5CHB3_9GAMM|nr:hypothetical protein [Methylovulum psychrotolerans]POZ50198.1 hypothetical protein AADEFJLK_03947 [Methylovulum psychrotolerans]